MILANIQRGLYFSMNKHTKKKFMRTNLRISSLCINSIWCANWVCVDGKILNMADWVVVI